MRARAAACLAAAERHALPSLDPALLPCAPPARPGEDPAEAIRPSTWRTNLSEIETLFAATSQEVADGQTALGAMPLVVLTGADTYKAIADPRARLAVEALWARCAARWRPFHARWRGSQRVERSGHDHPRPPWTRSPPPWTRC